MTISSHFVHAFKTVSWPSQIFLYHFLATLRQFLPISLRKPTISRTIPNSLSSFGPFPDHLTPFRAVSWPFPDHLRPLHDHFRLFPDQFTTIHAVSLPFQNGSGPLKYHFYRLSSPSLHNSWPFSWPTCDHSLTISNDFRPLFLTISRHFITISWPFQAISWPF